MRQLTRKLVLPAALATLAGASAGCSVVADAGSYRYDVGCDLRMRLLGFEVHQTHALFVRVDEPAATAGGIANRRGLAVLDVVPLGVVTLDVPNGVPTVNANLDFFADNTEPFDQFNPINQAGTGRGDHSWTIYGACDEPMNQFTHVALFDDFAESAGPGDSFQFATNGLLADGKNVEIRMTQYDPSLDLVDGAGDGRFTLVMYRRNAATGDDFTSRIIPGMLDRGVDFEVEVWVDRDDDQVVDDGGAPAVDEGYVFRFSAQVPTPLGTLPIPATGDVVLDVANAGTDDHSGHPCVTVAAP